jgi:hypothetical protein
MYTPNFKHLFLLKFKVLYIETVKEQKFCTLANLKFPEYSRWAFPHVVAKENRKFRSLQQFRQVPDAAVGSRNISENSPRTPRAE